MLLLVSTLHNSTYTRESQNKYELRTNTKILTRRLCVWSACCFVFTTHIQSLKHSSYSYLTTRMMLSMISTLHNSTSRQHESENKFDSRTDSKILSKGLCVCSACCSVFFAYVSYFLFFSFATTTDSVYFNEWFKSLEL